MTDTVSSRTSLKQYERQENSGLAKQVVLRGVLVTRCTQISSALEV